MSQLADRSGVTLRIYHRLVESMEQRKIIQNATRRNKLKSGGNDVNDTIEAEGNLQDVIELLANLRKNKEPLLHCSVFIELKARSMDALKELQSDIAMELTRSKISVDRLTLRQKEGFLSVIPTGYNQFGAQYERVLPASSVANLYPFNFSGKTDPQGLYIGRDKYGTNILVDFDRRAEDKTTSNVLILGNSGQGKSYLLKLILTNIRESGKAIICLDPESEYEELCNALGGCYIDFMSGEYTINPLEPKAWTDSVEDIDATTPEAFKKVTRLSQHIAFLKDFFRSYKDFSDTQIDTIEILLSKLYARFGITDATDYSTKKPTDFPIMEDFYKLCEEEFYSYDVQRRAYTDKINGEPGWTMVGIYADKGITGTSVKKRDDFNRLMRHCKQGKVDMIITKSVARFARNTLDCLKHTRMLKEHNVDVYFEEQGIHSIQPGAEFYITIYGSIAQSESENISANVRWGKAQSAKEGNVPFHYKRFLGYRRGPDGKPEIDPEQAVVVKRIYERFLAGDSLATIANNLNADGIPTPSGIGQWQRGTIESILTNEKYKGDAILNKTYIRDCLSKKVMINNGERPKYYVENNHPAIIDSGTFGRVQEEMARRGGKRKVKQVGTKTEQGRYSSKYALTELLICGECGTPYRRCTWAANGKKKVVWRCINRLDYGKKYCHDSPSIEESVLQEAIMKAVLQTAKQNADVLKTLKLHIGMGLSAETTEDNSLDLQIRIAEVEAEFQKMLKAIAADNVEAFDEEKAKALMGEKAKLQIQLDRIADTKQKRENAKSRLDEIFTIIEALANHPISYDDQIVRQVLESVIVESKEKIKVVFVGGLEVTQLM